MNIAILEGLLFVAGDEGLSFEKLQKTLKIKEEDLNILIDEYKKELESEKRGLQLEKYGNNYKLITKKKHAEYYKSLVDEEINDNLTPAALETLAIIAYNEPITRLAVDEIRGVSSAYIIRKLVIKNLIEEKGKSELPGKPILYGITDQFLDYLGIKSVNELPIIEEKEENSNQELFTSKYTEE